MIGLKFRDKVLSIGSAVVDEFENIASSLKAWGLLEHGTDGSHGDVTALSVASLGGFSEHSRGVNLGEWEPLRIDTSMMSSDSGTFTFSLTNNFFRYTKWGKAVTLAFTIFNSGVITGTPEFLRIKLPAELTAKKQGDTFLLDDRVGGAVGMSNQGAVYVYVASTVGAPETSYLVFEPAPSGLFAADANFGVTGQITWELANV